MRRVFGDLEERLEVQEHRHLEFHAYAGTKNALAPLLHPTSDHHNHLGFVVADVQAA